VDRSQSAFRGVRSTVVFGAVTMKTQFASSPTLRKILSYGFVYLLWFINILVCVVALVQFRSTVNVWWVALGGDRFLLGLVNQGCWLIGGFVVFVYGMLLKKSLS
jgi:hypothetical protein